jgi:acetyltransferase-like isoleucine patch superfamily enzyme
VADFIDFLIGCAQRVRRAYYSRVIFARVDADRSSIILGPDVCRDFHLVEPGRLTIGIGTVLNGHCYINAQGGVRIGRYCHIAKGLTLLSSSHNFRSRVAIPYDDTDIFKPVEIGEAVWIGANVCIHPGSAIGDGAIIALGAVVRGIVPPCAIVAGNPAEVVGWRDRDMFERLRAQGAFS